MVAVVVDVVEMAVETKDIACGSTGRTGAETCTSAQKISNRQYIPGVYTHGSNAGTMQKETRYASCIIAQRMQKETICSCCVDAHKECKDNEKTDEISTEEELPAICYSCVYTQKQCKDDAKTDDMFFLRK